MRIKYSYCENYNEKLKSILDDYGIKYHIVGDDHFVRRMISFAVYSDMESYAVLQKHARGKPITTKVFTHQELKNASFLTIIPHNNNVDIINADEAFDYSCKKRTLLGEWRFSHKKQIGTLMIRFLKSSKNTVFFTSSTGGMELFARKSFCKSAKQNNITGITFLPVFSGKGEAGEDMELLQLFSDETIAADLICGYEKKQLHRCSICGKPKILCGTDYQLELQCAKEDLHHDFYMTESIFGDGFSYPMYLISQRLHQLILQEKMDKNVEFLPVILK